jgi:hypothetical protein
MTTVNGGRMVGGFGLVSSVSEACTHISMCPPPGWVVAASCWGSRQGRQVDAGALRQPTMLPLCACGRWLARTTVALPRTQ